MYRDPPKPTEKEDTSWRDLHRHRFEKSRWFKRGWTLQELIAPKNVNFYDRDWAFLGHKSSLRDAIQSAAHIDIGHLLLGDNASIAQKMSWASDRETTRPEDEAYCLLGLFDVNMPLLYGEGEKAFTRLQYEIIQKPTFGMMDESIFAWTDERFWTTGFLADSPRQFASSGAIVPANSGFIDRNAFSMTNEGLQIELLSVKETIKGTAFDVPLRCRFSGDYEAFISLHVQRVDRSQGLSRAVRTYPCELITWPLKHCITMTRETFYIKDLRQRRLKPAEELLGKEVPHREADFWDTTIKTDLGLDTKDTQDLHLLLAGLIDRDSLGRYTRYTDALVPHESRSMSSVAICLSSQRAELQIYFYYGFPEYRKGQWRGQRRTSRLQEGQILITPWACKKMLVLAFGSHQDSSQGPGRSWLAIQVLGSDEHQNNHHNYGTICDEMPGDMDALEYSVYGHRDWLARVRHGHSRYQASALGPAPSIYSLTDWTK